MRLNNYDKTKVVSNLELQMVYMEPGAFMMGDDDENPAYQVTLTKDYRIGKYEVTQEEYQSIMGNNPSEFKGERKPVEKVSWNDAVNFCQKLTERERAAGRLPSGYEYRLPTEAEWEYAASGGNKSRNYKYSGSNDLNEVAWYYENSGQKTYEVGTKKANELGIYDMSGNVWEWCLDWHETYPRGSVRTPQGALSGSCRVLRGGSWGSSASRCRVAFRNNNSPGFTHFNVGFRAAIAPVQR